MPTQLIPRVTATLVVAVCTCVQFASELSAQEKSSRRMAPPTFHVPEVVETPGVAEKATVKKTAAPAPATQQSSPVHVSVPSLEDLEMFRVPTVDSKSQNGYRLQTDSSQLPQINYSVTPTPSPSNHFTRPSDWYSIRKARELNGQLVGFSKRTKNFALPQQQTKEKVEQLANQQLDLKDNQKYAAAMANEESLLDRLPVSNLNAGIVSNPVSRANTRSTIGDPYLASRSYGGNLRANTYAKTKTWRSPNMRHRPLYFEETNLERYGHTLPRLQPLISGAHFFSSVVFLPYKMGVTPITDCQYSLGYNRPGDCAPKVREQHPFSPRGALRQAAAVAVGAVSL